MMPLAAFDRVLKVGRQSGLEGFRDDVWLLDLPDAVTCLCKFDNDQEMLDLSFDDGKGPLDLQVMVARNKRGRWFFRCDCCLACRDFLIMDDRRFVCRESFVHEAQRGDCSMRRASVTMAIRDLGVLKPRAKPIRRDRPDKPPMIDGPALEAGPVDKTSRQPTDWYTTARALVLGRGAFQHAHAMRASELSPEYWASLDPAEGYERPHKPARRQLFPELDIRTLINRFDSSPESFLARTLCWGERAGPHDEVLLILDWRGSKLQAIVDHNPFDDVPRWQPLPLAQRTNGRFHFVCPIEKQACESLYLRNGLFASFTAQRMVYPSQRVKGKSSRKSRQV